MLQGASVGGLYIIPSNVVMKLILRELGRRKPLAIKSKVAACSHFS